MNGESSGAGKVAVHRWFADGEDWACHPWYAARHADLLRALDRRLKSSEDGAFEVPALGGVLLGERVPDTDCPDPKARDRRPTILRVAFLPHPPRDDERPKILEKLRDVPLPERPGQSPDLALEVPIPISPRAHVAEPAERGGDPEPDQAPPPPQGSRRFVLPAAIAVAAVAVILFLVVRALHPRDGQEEAGAVPRPDGHAAPPGEARGPEGAPPSGIAGDRFDPARLNGETFRKGVGDYKEVRHPYIAFLNHFADKLPARPGGPVTRQEYLRQVLRGLTGGIATAPADEAALRERVAAALSYDAWRKRHRQEDYADRRKPLPRGLCELVEEWRDPEAFAPAAEQMAARLRRWGEKDAPTASFARVHPFVVIDRFFRFLTRPASLPRPIEMDQPAVAFLSRLPREPVGEGVVCEDTGDLGMRLAELVAHLQEGAPPEVVPPLEELFRGLDAGLDYPAWQRRHGKESYAHARQPLPDGIEGFLNGFRRAPRAD